MCIIQSRPRRRPRPVFSCLFRSAASSSPRPCASIPLTCITWPSLVLGGNSRWSGADKSGFGLTHAVSPRIVIDSYPVPHTSVLCFSSQKPLERRLIVRRPGLPPRRRSKTAAVIKRFPLLTQTLVLSVLPYPASRPSSAPSSPRSSE
ncbi:hypothetical protein M440DRAFT_333137 [Trichoderma longibrachiatum ATCC 18648]|uniref:Uncharacterized protein n=1 Tax=Trichoderma longibrachiatum ATCC 18648 TaxID=983965 RepID=A0A2T4C314_TRILO|nr:hypothetical protein M440DRAFT_333137 [Trichoderma longibrachiatum ATCC 18648]